MNTERLKECTACGALIRATPEAVAKHREWHSKQTPVKPVRRRPAARTTLEDPRLTSAWMTGELPRGRRPVRRPPLFADPPRAQLFGGLDVIEGRGAAPGPRPGQ